MTLKRPGGVVMGLMVTGLLVVGQIDGRKIPPRWSLLIAGASQSGSPPVSVSCTLSLCEYHSGSPCLLLWLSDSSACQMFLYLTPFLVSVGQRRPIKVNCLSSIKSTAYCLRLGVALSRKYGPFTIVAQIRSNTVGRNVLVFELLNWDGKHPHAVSHLRSLWKFQVLPQALWKLRSTCTFFCLFLFSCTKDECSTRR